MLRELLTPEIEELISGKDWRVLKDIFSEWPAQDIVELLNTVSDEEQVIIFRLLHRDLSAEVFSELDSSAQKHLIQQMSNERIREIVLELPPDDRTDLFEELPAKVTKQILSLLPSEERREAMKLLGYPEESIGRLMTPDFVAIRSWWTVAKSLEHIRAFGHDAETIDIVYVVDDNWHLLDDIELKKLVMASPEDKIETLMDRDFFSVSAAEDQEEAVNIIKKYNLIVLPVVDSKNVLLGVVTVDDVIDVYEEEVTEDIHKGASVIPFEVNYTTATAFSLFRKRIVWLLLLAIAGFLSGNVIAAFEDTLSTLIILAFFIPVLIDTGGNTGTQSATLIIRSLVTGDLTPQKWFSVIKKELYVGIMLGGGLGGILCLWSYMWKGELLVSIVIGLSVFIIAVWSNLIGSILPILLRKFRLDPAVVSSPLITTIMDVTGLFIYFAIATLLIKVI